MRKKVIRCSLNPKSIEKAMRGIEEYKQEMRNMDSIAMRTISKIMTILSAMNKKWSAPIFGAQTTSINKNKAAFRE